MKPPEFYRGREKTFVKHLFLERYLERVAYNIGSFDSEFVYVDGFSGPWRSEDEEYGDTSFGIAIRKLQQVRDGLRARGRNLNIRCLFIEKNSKAFEELQDATREIKDISVETVKGEFEDKVPDIVRFVGSSFSLVFIDPTGWTGFGLNFIEPILKLRGEVLVNFMYDEINRHLEDARPEQIATYSPLFGGAGWQEEIRELIESGMTREGAVVEVYRKRFKSSGNFRYGTTTRVLKPLADRTFFHLVYGTRHWKGLVEFRRVEKLVVDIQEQVRDAAKLEYRAERTGQNELFGLEAQASNRPTYSAEREQKCERAVATLRELISKSGSILYEEILPHLLESALVWESDIKQWLIDMRNAGEIEIRGMKPRERTPKRGHMIVRLPQ